MAFLSLPAFLTITSIFQSSFTRLKIVDDDERTHKDPKPLIKVVNLGDNSVDINVRVWVNSGDFALYKMDLLETVKKTFDAEGISFPFPQREVTMHTEDSSNP